MALPLLLVPVILKGAAIAAGAVGVGAGAVGAKKSYDATKDIKAINAMHQKNLDRFDRNSKETQTTMDQLGTLELEVIQSFETFSNLMEQIQNAPEFAAYNKHDIDLPAYNPEELKKVYAMAGTLLSGLGGAALGTAGGFAAAGATTAIVTAIGTASTGTAISTLSGVALTNATLAFLGGGALAAGGGGMVAGAAALSAATLGAGVLVGGVVFAFASKSLSNKAEEAAQQMESAKKEIDTICVYFNRLDIAAASYKAVMERVQAVYQKHLTTLDYQVNSAKRMDWNEFTDAEKMLLENTVLLVSLLYKMCQIPVLLAPEKEGSPAIINSVDLDTSEDNARVLLRSIENG